MNVRCAPAVCFMAVAIAGCGKAPAASQQVTAESVQPGGTAFTTMRPLTQADIDRARALAGARGADTLGPPPELWQKLVVIYYGSPAQVTVRTPDGRQLSDTTAPADDSCDGFDESHKDTPETGVGCDSHDRQLEFSNVPPGEAVVQLIATDSGSIWVAVEAYSRAGDKNQYRHETEYRLRRGVDQQLRIELPAPHSPDSMRVELSSGAAILPPRADHEAFQLWTTGEVAYLLTDPFGRRVGRAPGDMNILREIPEAVYDCCELMSRDTIGTQIVYEDGLGTSVPHPAAGRYTLRLVAIDSGRVALSFSFLDAFNVTTTAEFPHRLMRRGEVREFTFEYPARGIPAPVVREGAPTPPR